jgi:hypothetical protein
MLCKAHLMLVTPMAIAPGYKSVSSGWNTFENVIVQILQCVQVFSKDILSCSVKQQMLFSVPVNMNLHKKPFSLFLKPFGQYMI